MVGNSFIYRYPSIQSIYLSIYLSKIRQSANHPANQPSIHPDRTNKQNTESNQITRTSPSNQPHLQTRKTLPRPPQAISQENHKHSTQQLQSKLFGSSRNSRRNDFDSPLGDFDGFVASFGRVLCCWVSILPNSSLLFGFLFLFLFLHFLISSFLRDMLCVC